MLSFTPFRKDAPSLWLDAFKYVADKPELGEHLPMILSRESSIRSAIFGRRIIGTCYLVFFIGYMGLSKMSPVVYTRREKARRLSVFILEQQQ